MNSLLKELEIIKEKEQKFLSKSKKQNNIKKSIYEKVPGNLILILNSAFEKAFKLVFLNGTQFIEKTFDKEGTDMDFEAGNFAVEKFANKKSIKKLDKNSYKNNLVNNAATAVSGAGLGLLGLGIPDIPLLVSALLKGIYEIALSYGFNYETNEEKIYILRLLRTALASDEAKLLYNMQLESEECSDMSIDKEISLTSSVLSDAMLVEKFIQGIPVIGVIGGFVNHTIYRKISALAHIKYKKRYLYGKIKNLQ